MQKSKTALTLNNIDCTLISTGFETLDSLLGGGIRNSTITDIFGAAGSGKTQLAKQIAASCLISGGSVFFVDTTGKFRPNRVLEMIREAHGDAQSLERFDVLRATNSTEQSDALNMPACKAADLIIIDSASDLYSFEYGGESQFLKKNFVFMEYMHTLARLALRHSVPIVMTNMIREFDGVEKENLQSAIRQFTHVRIRLSKNDTRYSGSVMLPGKTVEFSYTLSPAGLAEPTQTI